MLVGGQEFSEEILERIRRQVVEDKSLTRTGLSREVCEWLNWRGADGRVKEMNCRVALLRLERRGVIELPEAREVSFARRREEVKGERSWPRVEMSFGELGEVKLIAVDSADGELSREWWEMMGEHHPLGGGPLCGAQMRYLVGSKEGYLGGLSFSAAAWRLRARDEWIGWDEEERKRGLERVVGNSRFLILPTVKVANLATHVLGQAVRRVGRDWEARYGIRPELLETFVDPLRNRGTCYGAANWIYLGETEGRGRQDRGHRAARECEGRRKEIWVYPLSGKWREEMREEGRGLRAKVRREGADWAEEEFGGCDLGDARLEERLLILARDFYERPRASIPEACNSRAKTKAAYRFLNHDETTMEKLLEAHYLATEERVRKESIVLAVQDTTSLNYTAHAAMEGLGPLGARTKKSKGLYVHSTLGFNLEGTPLGFLDVQSWARDRARADKEERRKLPIEEKQSGVWLKSYRAAAEVQARSPGTMLVSVGDREADIYQLFREALETPNGPKLLVRAKTNRKLQDEQGKLWETILAQEVSCIQVLRVPRQGKLPAREAHLAIRFAPVTLLPPSRQKKDAPAIPVWAVMAKEEDPPPGIKRLEWMLLTTLEVPNSEAAIEKLSWYTLRWGIEVLHRTLKSGCRIEERQLGTADRLEACLAIDLVVAWRIYHLSRLNREVPDIPCSIYFADAEWKALMVFTNRNPIPPSTPPTIREATRRVAALGGFLGRKGDGQPGTQTLWIGLQRLDDITATYLVMINATQVTVSSATDYG
jgi:hypothetical protein